LKDLDGSSVLKEQQALVVRVVFSGATTNSRQASREEVGCLLLMGDAPWPPLNQDIKVHGWHALDAMPVFLAVVFGRQIVAGQKKGSTQ